jgi:hypothetical protein
MQRVLLLVVADNLAKFVDLIAKLAIANQQISGVSMELGCHRMLAAIPSAVM